MLIAIAARRSQGDFDTGKSLTWVFAASFLALAFASAILYARTKKAGRDRRPTAAG
ncbi:MAG TPA: hypothetical protein VES60_09410 [Nakamurella sp.]|nr:hypothetical protein [Nakamurella sp.]